jgi:hypothetical protein
MGVIVVQGADILAKTGEARAAAAATPVTGVLVDECENAPQPE